MKGYCDKAMIVSLLVVMVMSILFFDTTMASPFDLGKIAVVYVCCAAMMIILAVSTINKPENIISRNSLNVPIAMLLVSGIISNIYSINPVISFFGVYKRYDGLLSFIAYIFIFYMVVRYVNITLVDRFLDVMIVVVTVSCVYGIFQRFGYDVYLWNSDLGGRVSSTFGHPAFFSAAIIMVIPLVIYKLFEEPRQYWYSVALVFMMMAFYFTKTRASFIGLIISCVTTVMFLSRLYWTRPWKRLAIPLAIIIVCSLSLNMISGSPITDRFTKDVSIKGTDLGMVLKGSTFARACAAVTSLHIISDYPVLGIGQDCLGLLYLPYLKMTYAHIGNIKLIENNNRAHNEFLDVMVSRGIVGLFTLVVFMIAYYHMVWRNRKYPVVLALGGGVLAYHVQNQFSFGHIPILVMFWMMVGFTVVVCKD